MVLASHQGVANTKSDNSAEKVPSTNPNGSKQLSQNLDASTTHSPEEHFVASPSKVVDQASIPIPSSSPSGQGGIETGNLGAIPSYKEDKESGKPENSSFSSTISGNKTHSDPPTRADASTTVRSLTASNGNGNLKSSGAEKAARPSFLSRLVHLLIPCVSPSSVHLDDIQPSGISLPVPTNKEDTPRKFQDDRTPMLIPDPPATTEEKLTEKANITQHATNLPELPAESRTIDSEQAAPAAEPTPRSDLENVMSGGVQAPGSGTAHERGRGVDSHQITTGEESEGSSFTEEDDIDDLNGMDEVDDDEDRLILNGGTGIPLGPDGLPRPLLPPVAPQHVGRKCLILDLDETLVHSSFKSIQQADYVVPVEIEYHWHNVYVIKRPGVDNFLKKMGEIYEVVVFTASLSKYADPVLDKLDTHHVVSHRLFRESCYNHKGNYVKDLSQLGRPISETIILDNSPASYIFHPNNAVPVSSWFNDPHDTELTDLVPFLADLGTVDDVRGVLDGAR